MLGRILNYILYFVFFSVGAFCPLIAMFFIDKEYFFNLLSISVNGMFILMVFYMGRAYIEKDLYSRISRDFLYKESAKYFASLVALHVYLRDVSGMCLSSPVIRKRIENDLYKLTGELSVILPMERCFFKHYMFFTDMHSKSCSGGFDCRELEDLKDMVSEIMSVCADSGYIGGYTFGVENEN